jgi:hypothetical protein
VALVGAALRARRSSAGGGVAAAALVPLIVWLVHGSVDWLWEFPALSAPALAFAALAGRLGPADPTPAATRDRPGSARIAPAVLAGLVGLASLVALALPWFSDRNIAGALTQWRVHPKLAARRLERAAAFAPWSTQPQLVAGLIAVERDRDGTAQFRAVARKDERDWFSRFELALSAGAAGERPRAAAYLYAARRRNPREVVIRTASATLRHGRVLTPRQARTFFARRLRHRFGR